MNKNDMPRHARITSIVFYIVGYITAIAANFFNHRFQVGVVFGIIAYAVLTSAILIFSKTLREKPWHYMVIQSILSTILSIVLSGAFDSAQVFVHSMFFHCVLCFIYLNVSFAKFHMVLTSIMLIAMTFFVVLVIRTTQSIIEYLFGSVLTFVSSYIILIMVQNICFQRRQNIEQERSLDDLLRVVEVKCDDAREATRSKTYFLANMSHEIRTPINTIIGMNEMILRESTEPDIRNYATDADSAAKSLLGIINDILDITKIEEGRITLNNVKYSLPTLISDVYNFIRLRAEAKNLQLVVEVDKTLPTGFFGDDMRLKQILLNLMTNAIKYTHKGTVTLKVTKVYDNVIRFSVKDTGIGIKTEDVGRLFKAFDRIEEKRNRSIEGTGLGLTITHNLLSKMNSVLEVESEYGKGSEFAFEVEQQITVPTPIGEFIPHSAREAEQYKANFVAPNAKILLVDDNAMNRKVFSNLLKKTKVQLTEAVSGKECLSLIKETHYDMIFLDHMMPELDGIETLHIMKRMRVSKCRETPVIVLTANAIAGAQEMYEKEGFDGFVSKPVDSRKLERTVSEFLPPALITFALSDELSESFETHKTSKAPAAEPLPVMEGIDWAYANMKLANDEVLLRDTIKMFGLAYSGDMAELNSHFDLAADGDFDGYRIKVHSMKSSALLIGAVQLGGMAMELEKAAREQNFTVIKAMHPIFAERWLCIGAQLKALTQPQGNRVSANGHENEIAKLAAEIREAAEDMDVDRLDGLSEKLGGYSFEGERAERVERIKTMILNFDIENLMTVEI